MEESQGSLQAALHSLGKALSKYDDLKIDELLVDIEAPPYECSQASDSQVAIDMEMSAQVPEEPSMRMDQIKKQSKKDKDRGMKPTHIPVLTNEILKDVLSRPEERKESGEPR